MGRGLGVALVASALTLTAAPAGAADRATPGAADGHVFSLLAKAPKDECYGGPGAGYAPMTADGCEPGRRPKVNQTTVSALTKAGGDLWFGTEPNALCLGLGELAARLGGATAMETDAWACEFGSGGFRAGLPDPTALAPELGDWRPPRLYRYRLAAEALDDVGQQLGGADHDRLAGTLAVRSAGSAGGTVLLAGPAVGGGDAGQAPAINLFAFDAATGSFMGSATVPGYRDVSRWIAVRGHLYAAAGTADGGGALLRWDGDADAAGAPGASLPALTEVGSLPSPGVDLVRHRGRLYVLTSPEPSPSTGARAGVYRTAPLGPGGTLAGSTAPLEEIWSADDYEPDPVTAGTYLGGAIASYHGRLVWGTAHAPLAAAAAHLAAYRNQYGGSPSIGDAFAAADGSERRTALFAADHLERGGPRVRLLYGNAELPVYEPGAGWTAEPNRMGQAPRLGEAGFGNRYDASSWSMAATPRGLYIGTVDWSEPMSTGLTSSLSGLLGFPIADLEPPTRFGGDLVELRSLRRPAAVVDRRGAGNPANHGIRTMVADGDRVYLGMANAMNLLPRGGWELRELAPAPIVQRRR